MYEKETNVWYFGAYINKHIRYDFILRSTYKIVRAATHFTDTEDIHIEPSDRIKKNIPTMKRYIF